MADLIASSASIEQCTTCGLVRCQLELRRKLLTLDGRKTELLCNLCIPYSSSLLQSHTPNQLSQIRGRRNRRATSKRLKLDVGNGIVRWINSNLQFHHIATCWGADQSSSYVAIQLGHASNISRTGVVIKDLLVVAPTT